MQIKKIDNNSFLIDMNKYSFCLTIDNNEVIIDKSRTTIYSISELIEFVLSLNTITEDINKKIDTDNIKTNIIENTRINL